MDIKLVGGTFIGALVSSFVGVLSIRQYYANILKEQKYQLETKLTEILNDPDITDNEKDEMKILYNNFIIKYNEITIEN